ncbi:MAG: hypothetical protein ABIJ56_18685 [Pseudomonadota bacterium]
MRAHHLTAFILAAAAALCLSCGGGGKFNYAKKYYPLKAEKRYYEEIEELNYEEVKSDPLKYRGARLGWFGIVKDYGDNKDGTITALLEYRTYRDRHLCDDRQIQNTCRVTVSHKAIGTFTATFKPRKEDSEGKFQINYKSLLRIYGTPTGDYDDEGGPIVSCEYYRHWPAGTYVTTAAANVLRQ